MEKKPFYRKGWHRQWQADADNARLLLHDSGLIVHVGDESGHLSGKPLNVETWEHGSNMPPGQRLELLRALLIEARDYVEYQEKRKARQ